MNERVSELGAVRQDWARLSRGENVFATWEWADAWRRHLGGDEELAIGIVRRGDGAASAILPLCVTRHASLRVARFIGGGPSDQLGPLYDPGISPDAAADLLRRHVTDTLGGGGLFLGERIWGAESLAHDVGEVIHHTASPVLPLRGTGFDELLAARSRNFRSQVRRRERRLHRAGTVVYRLTEDPDRLDADMRTLMSLHAARWHGPNAFSGKRAAFHLDFARSALRNGWLRLWTLELDGRPAAAWYGLRYGGIEYYSQSGRDPAFNSVHVGFVLLCHTIRSAMEEGMREYRFGRGDEAYKSRFAELDPGLDTTAIAAGVRGRLALAGVKALLGMPPGVRTAARRAASLVDRSDAGRRSGQPPPAGSPDAPRDPLLARHATGHRTADPPSAQRWPGT
ncbi:MAG: GNAT family N-acetyltransferase [Solirubrobacteraceae bacterium]